MRRRKQIPMPKTLNDCILLYQMGYRVEVNDGKYITISKEGKRRENIA